MDEFFNVKGLNGYYFFVIFLKENDFLSFAVFFSEFQNLKYNLLI